jgi:hydrogenase nickel incorporation protein HypA/HybF
MHELSLTRSLLEIALEKGQAAGAVRISTITLVVGKLSGAVPHSIEFCFEALAKGTLAEKADLLFEEPPGQAKCDCGTEFEVGDYYGVCPNCNQYGIAISGGDHLYVKEIEIERG